MLVFDAVDPAVCEPWLPERRGRCSCIRRCSLVERLGGADGLLVVPALTFAAAALTVAFVVGRVVVTFHWRRRSERRNVGSGVRAGCDGPIRPS